MNRILLALLIGCFLLFPWLLASVMLFNLTMVMVWGMAILGLNLLTGFTGQISVAHAAFIAIGAYTTALLTIDAGWSYPLTIPVAAAIGYVAGLLLGVPALRLKGFYLATVTLALTLALPALIKRFEGFTHGVDGIVVRRPVAPPGLSFLTSSQWRYYLTLVVAFLVVFVMRNLMKSGVGRALVAVRDGETVAECNGIDLLIYKAQAFGVSAAFASIAGSLYGLNVGIVAPDAFDLYLAIYLMASAVVGGIASIIGALVGAAFFVFVPVYAGIINPGLVGVIFGIVLILVMLLMPGGIAGTVPKLLP